MVNKNICKRINNVKYERYRPVPKCMPDTLVTKASTGTKVNTAENKHLSWRRKEHQLVSVRLKWNVTGLKDADSRLGLKSVFRCDRLIVGGQTEQQFSHSATRRRYLAYGCRCFCSTAGGREHSDRGRRRSWNAWCSVCCDSRRRRWLLWWNCRRLTRQFRRLHAPDFGIRLLHINHTCPRSCGPTVENDHM